MLGDATPFKYITYIKENHLFKIVPDPNDGRSGTHQRFRLDLGNNVKGAHVFNFKIYEDKEDIRNANAAYSPALPIN
ncbi:MAG: hypothetical protein LUF31_08030, partial [Fusobacterium sp.]|nr:hypothetical protein [Fusobacterium sp.]